MSEATNQRVVFSITYGCRNCGNAWERDYPARTEVYQNKIGDVVAVDSDAEFGDSNVVTCPNCKVRGKVAVDDRTPLGDDSE